MEHKPPPGWKPWKPPLEKRDRWGLRGKTAWDWLNLLVVPVGLALVAGVFTTVQIFLQSMQEDARQQALASYTAQVQRVLEKSRVQEASLQAYLDLMATLLLEHNLRESADGSEVRAIARAQTLAALRKQDDEGKSTVVRFLIDAGLLQASPSDGRGEAVIRLAGADLSSATLNGADLHGVDLSDADLSSGSRYGKGADLQGADLQGADLQGADLSQANLSQANLSGAEHITNEELEQQAFLEGATMPNGQKYEDWLMDKKAQGKDEKNE